MDKSVVWEFPIVYIFQRWLLECVLIFRLCSEEINVDLENNFPFRFLEAFKFSD